MPQFVIEIHPKKAAFDPLAKAVRAELLEAGNSPEEAQVSTQRLFRLEGELSDQQLKSVAETLLLDPVVEIAQIQGTEKHKKKSSEKKETVISVDVWPKTGVTDPVGETIEKGLRDLGLTNSIRAHAGVRYVFPKIKNVEALKRLVRQNLANEMIHDIIISRS